MQALDHMEAEYMFQEWLIQIEIHEVLEYDPTTRRVSSGIRCRRRIALSR